MDELSIYNRKLSQAEILAIFNAEYAGKCNVTVAPMVMLQPANLSAVHLPCPMCQEILTLTPANRGPFAGNVQ